MSWLPDILQIVALVLVSAGMSAGAVILAAKLRLDRIWKLSPGQPDRLIDSLASLAEAARNDGLLSIEPAAASIGVPCFPRGLALLLQGRSMSEVRRTLQDHVDRDAISPIRRMVVTPMSVLSALGLIGLGIALAGAGWLGASGESSRWGLIAATFALPSGFALAAASVLHIREAAARPTRMLDGIFAIETLALISAGRDGDFVRRSLRAMLPGQVPARAAAA